MRRLPVLDFLFSKISGLEEIKVKIRYEFADGTVSEVEVEESIGAVIIEEEKAGMQEEMNVVAGLIQQCINENARVALDQTEYQAKYNALADRFEKAK